MLYLGVKDLKLPSWFLWACHVCLDKTEGTVSGARCCVQRFSRGSGTENKTLWITLGAQGTSGLPCWDQCSSVPLLRIFGDNVGVTGTNILMWLRFSNASFYKTRVLSCWLLSVNSVLVKSIRSQAEHSGLFLCGL